jgi:hypothetical protein
LHKLCTILSASFLLILAVSILSQGAEAQAFLQDRITEPIDNANVSPMAGTVHPLAKPEFDQGLADNAKVLQSMSINFQRSATQEASLTALLQAQQDPASSSYHKWLTPAQFGQQFGISSADIAKVSAWLQQEGFTVTSVSQSSNSISFSGSIATAERAFQTQIHNYSVDGETHFANATQVSLPAALSGMVSDVRGLNDFRLKPRVRLAKRTSAQFTSGVSGAHYLAPGDFATIYDVGPLYSAGFTGKGVTIAVTGQTDIVPADITDFRAAAGLSVNNPTVVTVPGTTPPTAAAGAASGDLVETDLDLEWSGGVATGASIVLVTSDDVLTSLQYAIQNAINGITVPIISQSYGNCEAGYLTSDLTTIEAELQQANAQGQTLLFPAGDSGAADCDGGGTANNPIISATQGLAVDYPGSSVYSTSLGGSEFMGDGTAASPQTGAGTYWNSNGTGGVSDDLVSSAKSYIPEMVWNDTTISIANGGSLSAGGGGVSQLWSKPSWQAGVPGIPADGKRDVPDISLDAANYHDSYIFCSQVTTDASPTVFVSSCQATSFRLSDPGQQDDQTFPTLAGGTSFATPDFAGLLAIIEQKLGSGGGLGNINPSLYTLASNATTYASAFHDITTGNNQVPCTNGSPNCATSGSNNVIGYTAGTGYDQASGLGSVDANKLATAFAALVTATGTKTTIVTTPGTSLVINESVTFTATVTPNTLTTAPTGTVTFNVDGVPQTSGVTLSTAAPYTAALKTSFPTAGAHTVSATYSSGDSTYSGSTSQTVDVNVVSSGTAATTTVVTANPTTFALGGAVTLSATITATTAGTLTGPVTFTTGGTTIGTVKQVSIGTGDTATATLSVSAATASLGFAAGTDTITATYGGDTYNAISSGTTTVTVTNPGITLSATNITISSPSPGQTGTSTITLTSTGSYAGTANLTASAASSLDVSAQFGSTSIPLSAGGTATTTLTITTVAAGSVQKGPTGKFHKTAGQIAAAGGTAAGCLLLLLIPGIRKKRWPVALIMLVFLSVGAGLGCGGGTGGGAPSGTYTITVSAADSSNANITGSTTFTLTIN